jgi:hypothetical protein
MVKEFPGVDDLLATVREFLQRIGPDLPASSKYDGQVAVYLLDIARREIADFVRPAAEDAAATLCAEIRAGRRDDDWDSTLQSILEDTIARARIVRPGHLAAEHGTVAP